MSTHEPDRDPNTDPELYQRLVAYVFGELPEDERATLESALAEDPALRAEHARLEATLGVVKEALPEPELSPEVMSVLQAAAEKGPDRRRFTHLRGGRGVARLAAAAVVLVLGGTFAMQFFGGSMGRSNEVARAPKLRQAGEARMDEAGKRELQEFDAETLEQLRGLGYLGEGGAPRRAGRLEENRELKSEVADSQLKNPSAALRQRNRPADEPVPLAALQAPVKDEKNSYRGPGTRPRPRRRVARALRLPGRRHPVLRAWHRRPLPRTPLSPAPSSPRRRPTTKTPRTTTNRVDSRPTSPTKRSSCPIGSGHWGMSAMTRNRPLRPPAPTGSSSAAARRPGPRIVASRR